MLGTQTTDPWVIVFAYIFFFLVRSDDEMNELFLHELKFLQSCLHVNPKSYGVWEHRRFALQNMPSPDWERDLMLCNKFLSMDSRNCKWPICAHLETHTVF